MWHQSLPTLVHKVWSRLYNQQARPDRGQVVVLAMLPSLLKVIEEGQRHIRSLEERIIQANDQARNSLACFTLLAPSAVIEGPYHVEFPG